MIESVIVLALLLGLGFSYKYAWWRPAVSYKQARILMYHMIARPEAGQKFRGLRVDPLMFERQLAWFKQHGWTFMTMAELQAAQDQQPEKTVVITFDDGYEDNYTQALPLLKKYGAKATLYLVFDRHQRDWSTAKKAHHNSGELARIPKLSDEQVSEMLDSGVFELGGHTLTHCNLAAIDEKTKYEEVVKSKALLEQTFETTINSFAYPFGIYQKSDPALIAANGYLNAVTTIDGIQKNISEKPFELKRVKISGKDNFLAFKLRVKTGKRGLKK